MLAISSILRSVSTRGVAIKLNTDPSALKLKPKWRDEHAAVTFFFVAAVSAYLMDVAVDAFVYHYGSFWDVFVSTSPGILFGRVYIVISFAVIGVFMDLYMTYRRRTSVTFSALNSYGGKLYTAKDIQEVCRLTLDAMEKTLGFAYATFMVLEGSSLEVVGYRGSTKPRLHRLPMSGIKGITSRVAKTGVPVLVRDVTKSKDYVADFPGVRSELAVPIAAEGKIFGVLDVESCRSRALNEKDATLLQVLASYAGTAISNLSKRREIERRSSQLASLIKSSTTMLLTTDLRKRLKTVAEAVCDQGWRRVVLSLKDENLNTIDIVTAGLSPEEEQYLKEHQSPGEIWSKRLSSMFEQYRLGEFYYLPWTDPLVREQFKYALTGRVPKEEMVDWNPDDLLYIPLKLPGGHVVGIMNIDDPVDGRRPTMDSLIPLELFAHQAATAIENAKLLQQIREYAQHLEERVEERTADLRRSEEKVRSVLAASPDIIVATDTDGRIIECNEQTARMHGYSSRNEIVGKHVLGLIASKDQSRATEDRDRIIKYNTIQNVEYNFVRKDDTEFPVELSASVLQDASGNPTGFVIVAKDITERKRLETQLSKSERLAAIGELAAMIGHDLRNPLTGIAGATYYVKTRCGPTTDDKTRQMLNVIEEDVAHSNKIINDLIEYSREIKLDLEETSPRALVKEALSLVTIPENIQVTNRTPNKPAIDVDFEKLKRAFTNIIKNAIDAMPKGGTLKIECMQVDNNVRFTFSDTGTGMTKETLAKIWTPLFTTKAKGMGFGLPICKRFIEIHQGRIQAESIVGKGTTVTVTIPIKQKQEDEKLQIIVPESLLTARN